MIGQSVEFDKLVQDVCKVAKRGLVACYGSDGQSLPYTRLPSSNWQRICPAAKARYSLPYTKIPGPGDVYHNAGSSMRYAAITQIGIARWVERHKEDASCLPDLWPAVLGASGENAHVSDLALALWAGVIGERSECDRLAEAIRQTWSSQAGTCNAYELAWVVQACAAAQLEGRYEQFALDSVREEARNLLVALCRPGTGLFQRHRRPGVRHAVERRVACFADQVYPILALSTYGAAFEDDDCIEFSSRAVEVICRLQGPLGQWWWHYDTVSGNVCDEYPVYSVHQDGMAPMAILASDKVTGNDHTRNIELGLRWLFGDNELGEDLLKRQDGIVWRDIRRRELPRVGRFLRDVGCTTGLKPLRRPGSQSPRGFRINYECRPYHLGWILYAWADRNVCV